MIVTFSGNNSFLINGELNKLKAKLDDLAIVSLDGRESSLEDIKMEIQSYSLFTNKRLVILFEPSKARGFDEYVEQIEADTPETTMVIIVETAMDKRTSYYKFLQKNTNYKSFDKLAVPALVKWASDYASEQGGKLAASDASYLIDRVGDDQLLLSQEIAKLILYSPAINKQTIDLLSEQSASSTIFELLDAAFSLNSPKALRIYADQRLQKVEPMQILAMISWQLNTLALYMTSKNLAEPEVLSRSGLSPYTLSKARQIATKISFSNLKSLVNDLAGLDLRSKTTSFDLDEGLKNFIVGLSF